MFENLSCLFPSGSQPLVITDSSLVEGLFGQAGFKTQPLESFKRGAELPKELILVSTAASSFYDARQLQQAPFGSSILDIPLVSFVGDLDKAVPYLLSRLQTLDFASACRTSLRAVEAIQQATQPIRVTSRQRELRVELGEDVHIAQPHVEPLIRQGEMISLGQFLEVGLVPNKAGTSFAVYGELVCDGASVAHHHRNHEKSEPCALAAWTSLGRIRKAGGFPLLLSIHDSRVTSITTAMGDEVLSDFLPLTDRVFRGHLIEFALASLPASASTDWAINSQINEAAGGVHVALGTGVNAAHIDFIASSATWSLN